MADSAFPTRPAGINWPSVLRNGSRGNKKDYCEGDLGNSSCNSADYTSPWSPVLGTSTFSSAASPSYPPASSVIPPSSIGTSASNYGNGLSDPPSDSTPPLSVASSSVYSSWSSGALSSTIFSSSSSVTEPTSVSNSSDSGSSSSHTNVGAAVGGAIAGVIALALVAALALLLIRRRRRRRSRMAPSAEFMGRVHPRNPPPMSGDTSLPLARQTSIEDVAAPPPPFSVGDYSDPVYEKVRAAAELQDEYRARDEMYGDGRNEKSALIA